MKETKEGCRKWLVIKTRDGTYLFHFELGK